METGDIIKIFTAIGALIGGIMGAIHYYEGSPTPPTPTPTLTPLNQYQCSNGLWVTDSSKCPTPTLTPLNQYQCSNGLWVTDSSKCPTPTLTPEATPSATIKGITVDHNVYENDLKGMNIHVNFDINNLKGEKGEAVAYFFYADGTKIYSTATGYSTVDDQLSTSRHFTPPDEEYTYNDLSLFLPNNKIDLPSGNKYELKFHVVIYYGNTELTNTELTRSDWVNFNFYS